MCTADSAFLHFEDRVVILWQRLVCPVVTRLGAWNEFQVKFGQERRVDSWRGNLRLVTLVPAL